MNYTKDNIHDWIADYLSGRLPAEDREAIESDQELQEELRDLALTDYGLNVLGKMRGEHPSSDALASYAENPRLVERKIREELEQHLADCGECRKELELCRQALAAVKAGEAGQRPSWLERLWEHLSVPKFHIRPAYVYAATALLVAGIGWLVSDRTTDYKYTARVELTSEVVRDAGSVEGNEVVIGEDTEIVTLEFNPAIKEGTPYRFELVEPDGEVRLVYPHQTLTLDSLTGLQLPFAIEVPSMYLEEGRNRIRVVEEIADKGIPPDTAIVDFQVRRPAE